MQNINWTNKEKIESTPILLMNGLKDTSVPIDWAEMSYKQLDDEGITRD